MSAYKYCRVREGVVHLDVIVDGKRFRRSTGRPATPANLKYVDKNWQAEVDRILNKNKIEQVEDGEITVEKYGYKSLQANCFSRKDTTNSGYKRIFEMYIIPMFGSIALSKVVQIDLKLWQTMLSEKHNLSPKRIHSIRVVFQGIMKDAFNDNLITRNPFHSLKGVPRKTLKDILPLSLDEVKYILANTDGWLRNFLTTAFFTGMRTGELLGLKWDDVNLHLRKIVVRSSMSLGVLGSTKTGKIREIDMLPHVAVALREQFKSTGLQGGFVFYSKRTKEAFTNSSSVSKLYWKPLLKRLLINERTLYQTRHTFATIMISKGEDIMWVSNMLGHSNSSITLSVYARYREDQTVKRASFLDEVEIFKTA